MPRKVNEEYLEKDTNFKFGKRLNEIRNQQGVSIQKLSDILDVSRNFITQLEKGDKYPSLAILISIANYFEISTDDLLRDYLSPSIQNKIIGDKIAQSIAPLSLSQQKHIEEMIKNEVNFLLGTKKS
ncbi:MAG: helix-turn-helix transcriptional regulator [Paludibacteraceae bacterium]|nr:helix-turn-helix transcriptional regulator [Paludibacteraceae bacterium]